MTFAWPDTTRSAIAAAREDLQRVMSIVAVASGLASARRPIDLNGLESAAGALCARLLDLPPQDGRSFRPALTELNDTLQRLSATLRLKSE